MCVCVCVCVKRRTDIHTLRSIYMHIYLTNLSASGNIFYLVNFKMEYI